MKLTREHPATLPTNKASNLSCTWLHLRAPLRDLNGITRRFPSGGNEGEKNVQKNIHLQTLTKKQSKRIAFSTPPPPPRLSTHRSIHNKKVQSRGLHSNLQCTRGLFFSKASLRADGGECSRVNDQVLTAAATPLITLRGLPSASFPARTPPRMHM